MIRSMTGFGEGADHENGVHYFIEIRSLNGKYFKCTIRLPEELQGLEPVLEAAVRRRLVSVGRPLPGAAFLYALEDASEARRLGETVALALIVLGEAGPAESHDLALGAVLSGLTRVGLEREARALAIEAALANGI